MLAFGHPQLCCLSHTHSSLAGSAHTHARAHALIQKLAMVKTETTAEFDSELHKFLSSHQLSSIRQISHDQRARTSARGSCSLDSCSQLSCRSVYADLCFCSSLKDDSHSATIPARTLLSKTGQNLLVQADPLLLTTP